MKTKHFGEIEIKEDRVYTFVDGIPGFEDLHQYMIIENTEEDMPFHWLQSLEEPNLAFTIINPFTFKKDYEFDIDGVTLDKLDIKSHKDVVVYAIVTIPEDVSKMSANLAAPLIMNHVNRKGKQVLLQDSKYTSKHLILEEIKNASGIGHHSEEATEEVL